MVHIVNKVVDIGLQYLVGNELSLRDWRVLTVSYLNHCACRISLCSFGCVCYFNMELQVLVQTRQTDRPSTQRLFKGVPL